MFVAALKHAYTQLQKRLTDDFSCYGVYCRLFSTRYRNKHRGQLRIKQIDVGRNQPPVGDRFMAHYNYKLAPDISEYVRYRKHDRHGFYTLIECPELEQNDEWSLFDVSERENIFRTCYDLLQTTNWQAIHKVSQDY